MNIQNHVASLELSKKLAEYVKLDTQFYWCKRPTIGEYEVVFYEDKRQLEKDYIADRYGLIPAPLASELWEILPHKIRSHCYLEVYKKQPYNMASYRKYQEDITIGDIQGPVGNLAETLGRMLIYLYENKLIKEQL